MLVILHLVGNITFVLLLHLFTKSLPPPPSKTIIFVKRVQKTSAAGSPLRVGGGTHLSAGVVADDAGQDEDGHGAVLRLRVF